jgi:hypothetical protein
VPESRECFATCATCPTASCRGATQTVFQSFHSSTCKKTKYLEKLRY